MSTPTLATFKKKLPKFSAWLSEAGGEMLAPTNEWEMLRFRGDRGTSIVYRDKGGNLTFTGDAAPAWNCYSRGNPYRVTKAATRKHVKDVTVRTLLERDGCDCFYCLFPLGDDMTVEHLLSATHGGPSHITNLALAHSACNLQAGNLSLPEKISMHTDAVIAMHQLGRKAA
jgi:hypothetical protein